MLLDRGKASLLLIDMQERLVPAMANRDAILDNTRKLLAFAGIIGLPVVVTEQEKLGATILDLTPSRQRVEPISKITFNCFLTDQFVEAVRSSGRKSLILTGIEAHICVAQTALYAAPGFNVHVVRDAISSRSVDNCNTAVERMRLNGVTITSTEMVIYELLGRAGTDEFKSVLGLVK